MAVGTPPFCSGRSGIQAVEQCGGEYGTICDPSLMDRSIRSDDDVTDNRMDAVSTDDGVAAHACAIRKGQYDLARLLIDPRQLFVQVDDVFRKCREQGIMQIRPM